MVNNEKSINRNVGFMDLEKRSSKDSVPREDSNRGVTCLGTLLHLQ